MKASVLLHGSNLKLGRDTATWVYICIETKKLGPGDADVYTAVFEHLADDICGIWHVGTFSWQEHMWYLTMERQAKQEVRKKRRWTAIYSMLFTTLQVFCIYLLSLSFIHSFIHSCSTISLGFRTKTVTQLQTVIVAFVCLVITAPNNRQRM